MKSIKITIALSAIISLAACGGDTGNNSNERELSLIDNPTESNPATIVTTYPSLDDLPNCTVDREAVMYLVESNGETYICQSNRWESIGILAQNENDLPSCTDNREGRKSYISQTGQTLFCHDNKWQIKQPPDTNDSDDKNLLLSSSSIVKTILTSSSSNKAISSSSEPLEDELGECGISNHGEILRNLNDLIWYICNSTNWRKATDIEVDTYGWENGEEGELRNGKINTENYYVYEDGSWRTIKNDFEIILGACTANRQDDIGELEGIYYICKNTNWQQATWLDDTKGLTCLQNDIMLSGIIDTTNKYVCDDNVIRAATEKEIYLGKACTHHTENSEATKQISSYLDSIWICSNGLWNEFEIRPHYESLTDSRDGKKYKTTIIGSQIWMAENLNFSDSTLYPEIKGRSWCYENNADNCVKYGRLYSWSVALDSVGKFSSNSKGCGNGKKCSPQNPVRGICPEGWHIPDTTEWKILYETAGRNISKLKATSWDGGSDDFNFSILPAGVYNNGFSQIDTSAFFWTINDILASNAFAIDWHIRSNATGFDNYRYKYNGLSIRCIQDS